MIIDRSKPRDGENRMWRSTERPVTALFAILGFTVFGLVVLAALLELTAWATWTAYHAKHLEGPYNQAASPVYAGAAWAPEFWQEEHLRQKSRHFYTPFLLWGVTNWHSKYLNNDESKTGVWRRTINPAQGECKTRPVAVWVFGGSTVYGTGVPDWATIPSYLSRDLNASSDCAVVSNFGVEGYVSNQELIVLMQQLKAGGRPDIVIFYDGLNDAGAAGPASGPPKPHFSFDAIKSRIEGSVSGRLDFLRESYTLRLAGEIRGFLFPQHSSQSVLDELHTKGVAALDNYEANLSVAKALGKAYNFRIYCFWQPSLFFGKKPLVPFERQLPEVATRDTWSLITTAVYQEAETRAAAGGSFTFLGGIFDSVPDPIFIDEGHLGPRGNELAAQAVAKYIQSHSGN
jgi:lysophospholipase L1-like esterase